MDRKRRFVDKYIRKLPGTGRTVALMFKGIQTSRSESASAWWPSSDEDV